MTPRTAIGELRGRTYEPPELRRRAFQRAIYGHHPGKPGQDFSGRRRAACRGGEVWQSKVRAVLLVVLLIAHRSSTYDSPRLRVRRREEARAGVVRARPEQPSSDSSDLRVASHSNVALPQVPREGGAAPSRQYGAAPCAPCKSPPSSTGRRPWCPRPSSPISSSSSPRRGGRGRSCGCGCGHRRSPPRASDGVGRARRGVHVDASRLDLLDLDRAAWPTGTTPRAPSVQVRRRALGTAALDRFDRLRQSQRVDPTTVGRAPAPQRSIRIIGPSAIVLATARRLAVVTVVERRRLLRPAAAVTPPPQEQLRSALPDRARDAAGERGPQRRDRRRAARQRERHLADAVRAVTSEWFSGLRSCDAMS